MNINKIKDILDIAVRFEPNDSFTWRVVESLIEGSVCNEELNPPEVIDRQCLRLKINNVIYEYGAIGNRLLSGTELVKIQEF